MWLSGFDKIIDKSLGSEQIYSNITIKVELTEELNKQQLDNAN